MGDPRITVRMYRGPQADGNKVARGLLGDCFLLSIEDGDARAFILIDCGVLTGTPDAAGVMHAVAQDIAAACGGRLDLVIATHQHADHLSGFAQAADLFFGGGIAIGDVWFAWTEDPEDDQANELRERFDRSRGKLAALTEAIATPGPRSPFAAAPHTALAGLDAFFAAAPTGTTAGTRMTTGAIIDRLRDTAGKGHVRYLGPGTVLRTPGAVPLDAVVMGPPRDRLLFKDLPTKRGDEVYAAPPGSTLALLDEALDPAQPDRSGHSPFAPGERRLTEVSVRAATDDPAAGPDDAARQWLRRRYYDDLPPDQPSRGGDAPDQSRRRIDGDWLSAAGEFALQLDSDTNNTSLVIAFALPNGDFMLFAGDAQVGNWESWHNQTYALGNATLTATDILGRTRLYKVGHHGSHNATLKAKGLELMTHPSLVAMVSTDEAFAQAPARGWRMPAGNTKRALLEATRGRLIRGDRRWREDEDVRPFPASGDFIARLDERAGLFVDYRVWGNAAEEQEREKTI
ncbi:Metallo-beta-lactamase superfamily protein [Sphingomonas gellani]|uniref:Metallo-beta-lactamase superfamily protein n=1 Tax=Sphingomonas gellani TaxID=1166340 RepID=A0A1H8I8H3_9SPHN|nr:MBL fold metallo-hydrolase [Sphingomonas gellani]SEN65003.1 Metallo-beta-lactamase superfamily protein [Sphingomonas gellani]